MQGIMNNLIYNVKDRRKRKRKRRRRKRRK